MADKEAVFEVVSPVGKVARAGPPKLGAPVSDLTGKTVGELWDHLGPGEQVFPLVREELKKRYPGIKFVPYTVFGNTHGPRERQVVGAIPEVLRENHVDVVISGLGV